MGGEAEGAPGGLRHSCEVNPHQVYQYGGFHQRGPQNEPAYTMVRTEGSQNGAPVIWKQPYEGALSAVDKHLSLKQRLHMVLRSSAYRMQVL